MSNAQRHALLLAGTQDKTVTGPRPPWFSAVSSAPSSVGNHDSITTAFNGDLSRLIFPIEHRITGSTTLTQPASGYVYTPEAYAIYGYLFTDSGHNQGTATNDGRTAAVFSRVKVDQYGQGDAVAYNGSVFVTGTKASSTNFLANPAGVLFNGDMTAGQAGVYLNAYETYQDDGGFDAAAIGIVNNFNRTVATGAKSAVWMGYRAQNVGSAACDGIVSATGLWQVGIDFAMSSLTFTNNAAISFKTGQMLYLNSTAGASGNLVADWRTTTVGTAWLRHNLSTTETQIGGAGVAQFAVGSTASAVNYLQAFGAATTGGPGLLAKGSDANISIGYRVKGAGAHIFYADEGSTPQFLVGRSASAVNYLGAYGAAAAGSPYIHAEGSDTNIPIIIASKGTGSVSVKTGGGAGTTQVLISNSGSLGIRDGVTAPGTVAGFAQIYVDTADGDLKVIFGDGTIKTIVTDT